MFQNNSIIFLTVILSRRYNYLKIVKNLGENDNPLIVVFSIKSINYIKFFIIYPTIKQSLMITLIVALIDRFETKSIV